jgi:hypothetical protein
MGRKKLTDPNSEVVKIRISKSAKEIVDTVCQKEYRTFQEQVRMIVDAWAIKNKKQSMSQSI